MPERERPNAANAPVETEESAPPPLRWFRRLLLTYAMMLLALPLMWVGWDQISKRRAATLIEAAHAKGLRIVPEDFNNLEPAVPAAENGANALDAFLDQLTGSDGDPTRVNDGPAADSADAAILHSITLAHLSEVTSAHAIARYRRFHWTVEGDSVDRAFLLYDHFGRLCYVMENCSYDAHARGDGARTVECLRDWQILNRAHAMRMPAAPAVFLYPHVEKEISQVICYCAHSLAIGGNRAEAETIRSMIAELSDQAYLRSRCRLYYELSAAVDLVKTAEPSPSGGAMARLLAPRERLIGVRAANDALSIAAATEANPPRVPSDLIHALPEADSYPDQLADGRILEPGGWRGLSHFYATLYQRQLEAMLWREIAATMLAIQLYRADHAGALPKTLSALVPDYLPSVPVDIFASDRRPIAYVPGAATPALYSVGYNGTDEGGSILKDQDPFETDWTAMPDIVFPLDPKPPTRTTQP